MGNMTEMDLVALRGYANELESFKSRVSKYCNDLEAGIRFCSHYMLDAKSRNVLDKGRQVAADIKICLLPVERLLEKAYDLMPDMDLSDDADFPG